MAQQTIVAHFDSRAEADVATAALVSDGLPRDAIQLLPEQGSTYTRSASDTAYDHRRDEGGFWASLGNLALPEEDRYSYAEGMSRGGVTLAVTVDPAHYDRTAQILEQFGSVDLEAREAEWRSSGWSGYTSEAGISAGTTMPAGRSAMDASGMAREDGVIPIVEEQLRVGKRVVDQGRVRIRSYMVETPVEAEVDLRSERVSIERHPVDRAVAPGDDRLFREQTLEAREHFEEAVVSKEARVVEEIGLRQETEVQHERIQDTVRKTEVEIEDERAAASEVEAERLRRTGPLTD